MVDDEGRSAGEDESLRVEVLGVQRTGSTWARSLVHRNVDVPELLGGRLHRPVEPDAADAFVVIMRDPWAWLVSFYKFQLHPIFGFVDRVWNKILHPPVDRFRAFRWWDYNLLHYEQWATMLPEDRTAWLHYEQMLPDPADELAEALDHLGVPRKDPIERDTSYRKDFSSPLAKIFSPEALKASSFDPTYYTEKRYLEEYRDDHMRVLLETAQRRGLAERFERFGYDMAEDVPEPHL